MAEQRYTLDIPGLNDFIKIPALEDKRLAQQRIARMKTAQSPVPDPLKWIPSVITKLDDAQDLLNTALVLAKPLIRRLPARFIPYVGWLLLVNDVLNFATFVMGTALGGRASKKVFLDQLSRITPGRTGSLKRVSDFLNRTNWFGFGIQAGQAIETLTGYGLQLGALMGLVSDATWLGVRTLLSGPQTAEIRTPPPADLSSKAARYLMQPSTDFLMLDVLSEEDAQLLLAARCLAIQVLSNDLSPQTFNQRGTEAEDLYVPVMRVWNPASREALEEAEIDPDGEQIPVTPPSAGMHPTFGAVSRAISPQLASFFEKMRYKTTSNLSEASLSVMLNDAAISAWRAVTGEENPITYRYFSVEKIFALMIESNSFPAREMSREEWIDFFVYMITSTRTLDLYENEKVNSVLIDDPWPLLTNYELREIVPSLSSGRVVYKIRAVLDVMGIGWTKRDWLIQ